MCLCQYTVQFGTGHKTVTLRAGTVTVGLAENKGSLPLDLWLQTPASWLPRDWNLVSSVWVTALSRHWLVMLVNCLLWHR